LQAIADIIVNTSSESQIKNLQLSQNINNSQNSSPSVSFEELLHSQKAEEVVQKPSNEIKAEEKSPEKLEEKKVESADKKTEAAAKTEVEGQKKTEESDENGKKLAEKKEKAVEVNASDKKIALEIKDEKETLNPENEKLLEKAENNQSKTNKIKAEKKNEMYSRLDELTQGDAYKTSSDEALASVNLENNLPDISQKLVEKKSTEEKVESALELDGLKKTSDTKEALLFGEKLETGNQKVKLSKLDKDGKIIVKDYRSEKEAVKAAENKTEAKLQTKLELTDQNTATITMDLNAKAAAENILSTNNQAAASDNSNFQAMLNNQLQQSAPEFVKAGSLILKDNDKGTINLVLHPDDIGNVKIHLNLDGKTISAQITVNTKEAMEVFKDNAQTLREAFAQNGFDTANFDVSYNQNGNNNQGFEQKSDGLEYIARHSYSDFAASDDGEYLQNNFYEKNSEYSINIVA